MEQFYVEIFRDKDSKVMSRMGPMSERRAEKVEDGAGINLNWEEYSTRIVPAKTRKGASGRKA